MRSLRTIISVVILSIATPFCLAQSDETQPTSSNTEPDKKQYQVEIIAFQYNGPDSSGGEKLDDLVIDNYLRQEPFDIDEYNRIREAISYTEIIHLSEALEKLRQDPLYSVILDIAWIQPLLNKDEAVEVPLGQVEVPLGQDVPTIEDTLDNGFRESAMNRLSGSMRVYGDYLLFVDLTLRAAAPREERFETQEGDTSVFSFFNRSDSQEPVSATSIRGGRFNVFQISEKRRIKLDEFHYFDHPNIGAIVSVTRYEGPGQQERVLAQ